MSNTTSPFEQWQLPVEATVMELESPPIVNLPWGFQGTSALCWSTRQKAVDFYSLVLQIAIYLEETAHCEFQVISYARPHWPALLSWG